jgi:ABC-type polysaccharide/polyol phosphate export permease
MDLKERKRLLQPSQVEIRPIPKAGTVLEILSGLYVLGHFHLAFALFCIRLCWHWGSLILIFAPLLTLCCEIIGTCVAILMLIVFSNIRDPRKLA